MKPTQRVEEEDYVTRFWRIQADILRKSYINTALVIINVVLFIYSYFFAKGLYDTLSLDSEILSQGKGIYRFLSAMFMHASPDHLISNMLVLIFVGANVEHDLGHIAYTLLYFLAGITGNLVSVFLDIRTGIYSSSIGASGAVFGVIGAVIVIVFFGRKYLRMRGSTLMPRLGLMLFFSLYSGFADSDINNAAHIGGLVGGVIFTLLITLIGRREYTMEEWL